MTDRPIRGNQPDTPPRDWSRVRRPQGSAAQPGPPPRVVSADAVQYTDAEGMTTIVAFVHTVAVKPPSRPFSVRNIGTEETTP